MVYFMHTHGFNVNRSSTGVAKAPGHVTEDTEQVVLRGALY